MRSIVFCCALLLMSCSSQWEATDDEVAAFVSRAASYQEMYVEGSRHCDDLLAMMDDEMHFSENGAEWTKGQLAEFCPHLPRKNVVHTIEERRLLAPGLGYDFVSQLYLRSRGDTMRETASRIWRRSEGEWRIVEMNNLLERIAPEE